MAKTTGKTKGKKVTEEPVAAETSTSFSNKKLYRPKTNRMLGGVCAGLALFLDFDPAVIRVIFIVVTLLGGSGVLIYFILWLILPTEDQPSVITQETIKVGADEMRQRAQTFAAEAKSYTKKTNPRTTVGIILIVLGAFFLLQNLNFFHFNFLAKFWPVILIVFAIYLIGKND